MKSLRNQELAEQNESKESRGISNLGKRRKMWWDESGWTPRWSPSGGAKIFLQRKAAERLRGRSFGRKERSGDDLGGLSEGREGARHEGCQGEHQAREPDQHWRGSLSRRVSGELKMGLSPLGRSDRRYTPVQVGEPIIELRAFPWSGGAA